MFQVVQHTSVYIVAAVTTAATGPVQGQYYDDDDDATCGKSMLRQS